MTPPREDNDLPAPPGMQLLGKWQIPAAEDSGAEANGLAAPPHKSPGSHPGEAELSLLFGDSVDKRRRGGEAVLHMIFAEDGEEGDG